MRIHKLYIWIVQLILCFALSQSIVQAQTSVDKYSTDIIYTGSNPNLPDTLRYKNVTIESNYVGDGVETSFIFASERIKIQPPANNTIKLTPGNTLAISLRASDPETIKYFNASDNAIYSKIKLTWTNKLPDGFNRIRIYRRRFDANNEPLEDKLLADFPENQNGIDITSFVDSGYTYIHNVNNNITKENIGLINGATYEYCLQAYNTETEYHKYGETGYFCDFGTTLEFELIAKQMVSDAYSSVNWKIDANCLKAPSGNDVYFVVKENTNNKVVYDQVIKPSDVDAFLASNKYISDYQLNIAKQSGYIDISQLNQSYHLSTWTNEFWFRLNDLPSTEGRDMYLLHGNSSYVYLDDADNKLKVYDGEHKSLDFEFPYTNTWYHVAMTSSSSGELLLFIDGIYQGAVKTTLRWKFDKAFGDGKNHAASASVSEWRIWSEVRTSQEILYNHRYERNGDERTLLAYFKLDAITGDILPVDLTPDHANAPLKAYKKGSDWSYFESNALHNNSFNYGISELLGPNASREYTLNIYDNVLGDPVCRTESDIAITEPYRGGQMVSISSNDPGKISLKWSTSTDLNKVFKIYRKESSESDYHYITDVYEQYEYNDHFAFGSQNGIQIGYTYDYKVTIYSEELEKEFDVATGQGSLYNYNITATPVNDSVVINMPNFTASGGTNIAYDSLKLYRNGEFLEYIVSKNSFDGTEKVTYRWPEFGAKETYEIRIVKDGKEYSGVSNDSYIAPNGVITGYVRTKEGSFCIADAEVKVTVAQNNKSNTYTTKTNQFGYFEVRDIYYGYNSSVSISAKYGKHDLESELSNYSINGKNRRLENVLIHDHSGFDLKETDEYTHPEFHIYSLNQFNGVMFLFDENKSNLLYNVYRCKQEENSGEIKDLQYFATITPGNSSSLPLSHGPRYGFTIPDIDNNLLSAPAIKVYNDSSATPGTSYEYHVIAYNAHKLTNKLSYQLIGKEFRQDMVDMSPSFTATKNINASVTFEFDSEYITRYYDGLAVYRDNKFIGASSGEDKSFTDYYGVPGSQPMYQIRAYVCNNGTDTVYTAPQSIRLQGYPHLIKPTNITATALNNEVAVKLTWDFESVEYEMEKDDFNFDGFAISAGFYGGGFSIVDHISKDGPNEYIHRADDGFGAIRNYLIQPYRINNPETTKDTIYDVGHWLNSTTYPVIPLTTIIRDQNVTTSLKLSWDYPYDFHDGFRIKIEDNNGWIPGVKYGKYYPITATVDQINGKKPTSEGVVENFSISNIITSSSKLEGVNFDSYIKVTEAGKYTFYLDSDDGSKLYIDNKLVINNDGVHGPVAKSNSVHLEAGYHPIRLRYFQAYGGLKMETFIEGPGISKQIIPSEMLFFKGKQTIASIDVHRSLRKFHYTNSNNRNNEYTVTLQIKTGDTYTDVDTLSGVKVKFLNNLETPASFTASEGEHEDYIRLSWDYPSYIKPDFEVYRDGILLDTLGDFMRSYYDYDSSLVPGKEYHYTMVAKLFHTIKNQWLISDTVHAYGSITSPYFIEGKVLTHNEINGIRDVEINVKIGAGNNAINVKTFTDDGGNFRIDNLPIESAGSSSLKISAYHKNYSFNSIETNIDPISKSAFVK
ncbi:MAG: PA14 domain-containing protein, partial [Bacteroidales bacterium]|nr:PA14 domain-containing protein [Bacteroidales bacterium]